MDTLVTLMVIFLKVRMEGGSMSDNSAIEWTDATWNPTTGRTKVSTGCDRCYAERIALRFGRSFYLELHPDWLEQPLRWRRPRRVFVNSVSDLFHRDVPWGFVDQVFGVMEAAEHHIYQVLTKRSSAMRDYLRQRYAGRMMPDHIWCGLSIGDQEAMVRVKHLQESPASVRFLSCKPLVGRLDLQPVPFLFSVWGGYIQIVHTLKRNGTALSVLARPRVLPVPNSPPASGIPL